MFILAKQTNQIKKPKLAKSPEVCKRYEQPEELLQNNTQELNQAFCRTT